jgi:hypothetical protein
VIAVCASLALAASVAIAQERDRIEPDRPDGADSTSTVPVGALQIESGVDYSRAKVGGIPAERRLAFGALLRAGLTDRIEVRLDGEPIVRLRGPDDDTGHGDLTVSAKYRFRDAREGNPWPALGVLPFVKIPITGGPIGSQRPDFGVVALAGFDLPWEFGLDLNAGVVAVGQSRGDDFVPQAVMAASLSLPLGDRWAVFVELLFASRDERDGRNAVGFDTGVTYFLTSRVALDAAVETSLAGPGPDYALRAGVSVRFGR